MNKFAKLAAALAAICLAGTFLTLSAAPQNSPRATPFGKQSSQPPASQFIYNRQLLSTTQSYGDSSGYNSGGKLVPVDSPLKFTCPSGSTCTVSAEQHLQVGGNAVTGNTFAICTEVDGTQMSQPPCPTLGEIPTDGSYVAGSFTQNMDNVQPGTHTLQTFFFTPSPAFAVYYDFTYRLYKP
ncbi:MAG TPA: hypothetical protein VMB18_13585 [Terriglobales bacterium]|nr:hypothetical protein [Terriglobales bacterium]